MADAHKNFAASLVATAPSPATSGTSLVVTGGDGTKFPAVPFNATIWPVGVQPTTANSEIVRVTAISTDTFTITRGATSGGGLNGEPNNQNRSVIVGDQIVAGITVRSLTDIEQSSGSAAQMVSVVSGAVATGTTILPYDDTIPQNTEGDQYMTLAITPKSATSKLVIQIVAHCANSVATETSIALFQDSTANALAADHIYQATANGGFLLVLTHTMTSGTTSATTFKVRIGTNSAATVTFNGQAAGRKFGGITASSIVITEYWP